LIGLEESVEELLPELADRRVLAVRTPARSHRRSRARDHQRDLLTFTFGFGMATRCSPLPAVPWSRPQPSCISPRSSRRISPCSRPRHVIANLGTLPLIAQPGERWLYTPGPRSSVCCCARRRRTAGRCSAIALVRTAGMKDTGFWTEHTDRLASAYRPRPAAWCCGPPGASSAGRRLLRRRRRAALDGRDLLAFARMLAATARRCSRAPLRLR